MSCEWTTSELAYLREAAGRVPLREIQLHLRRSAESVRKQAQSQGALPAGARMADGVVRRVRHLADAAAQERALRRVPAAGEHPAGRRADSRSAPLSADGAPFGVREGRGEERPPEGKRPAAREAGAVRRHALRAQPCGAGVPRCHGAVAGRAVAAALRRGEAAAQGHKGNRKEGEVMELVNQLAGIAIDLAVVWLAWENLQKGKALRELQREVEDLRSVVEQEAERGDSEASRLY